MSRADVIVGVLAEHPGWTEEVDEGRTDEWSVFWRFRCSGRTCRALLGRGAADAAHRAHVAAVLAAAEPAAEQAHAGARTDAEAALARVRALADVWARLAGEAMDADTREWLTAASSSLRAALAPADHDRSGAAAERTSL